MDSCCLGQSAANDLAASYRILCRQGCLGDTLMGSVNDRGWQAPLDSVENRTRVMQV
jgi:hypothetical protein